MLSSEEVKKAKCLIVYTAVCGFSAALSRTADSSLITSAFTLAMLAGLTYKLNERGKKRRSVFFFQSKNSGTEGEQILTNIVNEGAVVFDNVHKLLDRYLFR